MKKVIALVLVAMFGLGLAACSGENDVDSPDHILNQDRG